MYVIEDIANHTDSGFTKNSTITDVLEFYGKPMMEGKPRKNFLILRFPEADVTFYKDKLYSITQYNSVFSEYRHSSFKDDRTILEYVKHLDEKNIYWEPNHKYDTETSSAISIGNSTIVVFDEEADRVYSITQLYD